MQAVAEFVEQSAGIVRRQQRGLAARALGEIADIDDERGNRAVELLLIAQRGHPGAGSLRGAGVIVAIEQRLVLAVAIPDFPDPDVGVPGRDILALLEGDAEQAGGAVEGGLDHVVEHKIGLDRGVIEIGADLPELLGVVAPIPGCQRKIAALLRDQRLHRVAVGERPRPRRLPDPLQEAAHGVRRLGHGILEPVGGVVREAHDLGGFLAQRQDLDDGRVVVVGIAIVATRGEGLEDLFAQVAAIGGFQERLDRGARQRHDRLTGHPALFRRGLGGGDKAVRQPGAVVVAELHEPVLLVAEQMVAEAGAEMGEPLVDLSHPRLGGVVEASAGPAEARIGALQQPELLAAEAERGAVLVQERDATEQHGVHHDRVPVPRHPQGDFLVDLQDRRIGVRRHQAA